LELTRPRKPIVAHILLNRSRQGSVAVTAEFTWEMTFVCDRQLMLSRPPRATFSTRSIIDLLSAANLDNIRGDGGFTLGKAIIYIKLAGKLLDRTFHRKVVHVGNKKLSYRRGTARCVVSIEILPLATQQCRNYLYDKS